METFKFTVSTPDGNMLDEQVNAVFLRGADGDLAVLAKHIPFVTTVLKGECRISLSDGSEKKGYTHGGILSVSEAATVLISNSFSWNKE